MAKVHDKFVIELAEVIKGYGNDPDVDDPFHLSEFYRFYELPEIAVSTNNFKAMIPLADVQPVVRWISCSVINHCFIPELQDFPYGGFLFTYVTQKGKRLARETWIERGRIVGKKMNGTPIAYMPLPECYHGKRKGAGK